MCNPLGELVAPLACPGVLEEDDSSINGHQCYDVRSLNALNLTAIRKMSASCVLPDSEGWGVVSGFFQDCLY